MRKVLFIDRDGTLIREPEDEQVDSLEKLEFMPGVFGYLSRIVKEFDYQLVMVTNQDGLGTASFPEETFWPSQDKMLRALSNEGIHFADIIIDRTLPSENSDTRKPGIGLMSAYQFGNIDLDNSFVLGDRNTDVEFAQNLGCRSIQIISNNDSAADFHAIGWKEVYETLKSLQRVSHIKRKTSETEIDVEINLSGSGLSKIHTGLQFFDHMLEQLSRHGMIDLEITCNGDLEIDEHHTIEDTALTLGEAFSEALGDKRGIERYGFLLPMDDCLAQVAIDFSGRPWLVWDAEFKREKIGDMPTEMFMHFFKSFSDAAKCNLNIKAEGQNEHHKIESIFKAFSKAIRSAIRQEDTNQIPSTKGQL